MGFRRSCNEAADVLPRSPLVKLRMDATGGKRRNGVDSVTTSSSGQSLPSTTVLPGSFIFSLFLSVVSAAVCLALRPRPDNSTFRKAVQTMRGSMKHQVRLELRQWFIHSSNNACLYSCRLRW